MQVEREWHVLEDIVGAALHPARASGCATTPSRPHSRPTCRWCPPTTCCWSRCSSTCSRMRPSTRRPARRWRSGRARSRARVEVWVADRGPGLPAGERSHGSSRSSSAAREPRPGVGLGLTIVRGIVRAHRGEIHAEQRPGGGAVFRFTLPLTGDAARRPHGGRQLHPEPRSDERPRARDPADRGRAADAPIPAVGASASRISSSIEAGTAREGLAQAAGRRPDVVLLDLGLPDGDGIDVTRRLREWSTRPGHRDLGPRAGGGQGRGARRRRRRLPDQAVRDRRAAGAHPGGAPPRRDARGGSGRARSSSPRASGSTSPPAP